MKKYSILLMGAAIAMTSCSSDETADLNSGAEIKITANADAQSRGMSYYHNIEQFHMTALSPDGTTYLNDVVMDRQSGISSFKPSTPIYWPGTGNLDIYAYASQRKAVNGVTINKNTKKIENFMPAANVEDQFDLACVAKTAVRPTDLNTPVHLLFKHVLSSLFFRGRTYNKNYDVKIKQMKLINFVGKGTYTFENAVPEPNSSYKVCGSWKLDNSMLTDYNGAERTEDLLIPVSDRNSVTDQHTPGLTGNGVRESFYVLPQSLTGWSTTNKNGARMAFLVSYTSKENGKSVIEKTDAEGYAWVYAPFEYTLNPGCSYTFTIDFTNLGGKGINDETLVHTLNITCDIDGMYGASQSYTHDANITLEK